MKARAILLSLMTVTSIGLTACSTTPLVIDSKYSFPEFETVNSITNYTIDSWQPVDSQSLIVQVSPSKFYLVILRNRISDLNFNEGISFTSTGTQIQAKFDCVNVKDFYCSARSSPIERIYKIDGKENVKYVREKIRGSR